MKNVLLLSQSFFFLQTKMCLLPQMSNFLCDVNNGVCIITILTVVRIKLLSLQSYKKVFKKSNFWTSPGSEQYENWITYVISWKNIRWAIWFCNSDCRSRVLQKSKSVCAIRCVQHLYKIFKHCQYLYCDKNQINYERDINIWKLCLSKYRLRRR